MKTLFKSMAILTSFVALAAFADTKALDTKASHIQWKGTKVTGEHFGKLYYKEGKLEVVDGKIKGGEFVVDITTLTVEDLEGEWAQKFLDHMKSNDFFEIEKYPTAKLVIKSADGNKLKGDLTIKGKTNPIEFTYKEDKGVYSGDLEFDRTKFDMVYGSGSIFKGLGDKMIHDKVTLSFKLAIK